ncbi:hypothetical protein LDO32_04880 [Luteimonas sp. Y-2-2-4F]|nr:hypothetical protein [Luteimonas sp. Y-2-2-4F]MCD9031064.1 hypothetical protein [Luteimonas sp. Y-2-2-4F]
MALLALLTALAALLAAAVWLRARRRAERRRRALSGVLDAADAFEARLRAARAEIEAVAGPGQDPVREAMQEMLRQRLWLQRHGGEASPERLERVRDSIDGARARIEQQLDRLERARAH